MRIAVVQLAVKPEHRTETLQNALGEIDAVCEADPAPDLVLLPAFVDTLTVASKRAVVCERLHGQTASACGLRARNWGVFIALGQAERSSNKPFVTSVLIDRDGDIRLAQRQVSFETSGSDVFEAGERIAVTDVLLGRIALLTGDDLLDPGAWDAVIRAHAQIVLGTACWSQRESDERQIQQIRSRIAEQAKRCGRWCAVADVTTSPDGEGPYCPGLSAVFDEKGEIMAAAELGAATTFSVEVAIADPFVADDA
ncbi:MAG: carbon-nitrogen hydrolase family protein [Phycisphaerales bacterium]|nr:carbon-nitrogen hydrolase family protein [Phycisphaerales bacterium]